MMRRKKFMGHSNVKVGNISILKLEKLQLVGILQVFLSKMKS